MELLRSIQLEALPTSKQPSHSTKKLDFDSALDSDSILELGIELTRLDTAASLSNRRSSFSLPQVDGKSAESWKFLGAAFILEAFIWGYSFSYGVIDVYLSTHEPFSGSSKAAIASVGTISPGLGYMVPIVVVLTFQRYPDYIKKATYGAVIVNFLALFISSFATSVWQLILLQGVIAGFSTAVLYVPLIIWLNEWWIERRGMASGVIFAGTGLGGFVFPIVLGKLLDSVGYAWTIRIWSFISLIAFLGAYAVLKPRLPIIHYESVSERPPFFPRSLPRIFSPVINFMLVTTFFSSLSYFPISIYLSTYTAALASVVSPGVVTSLPPIVLAALNLSGVIGQVLIGYLADKVKYSTILVVLGVASSIIAFLSFGFASTLVQVFFFAILFGFFSGMVSTFTAVARDVAGSSANPAFVSILFCAFSISRGIASIIGPIVAAALFDYSSSDGGGGGGDFGKYGFKKITIFVGIMALLSAFGGVGLGFARKKMKTT